MLLSSCKYYACCLAFLVSLFSRAQTVTPGYPAPGSTAPDAIKLDVEAMSQFFGGYAIIEKGGNKALINHKGDIVLPYSTYNFTVADRKIGAYLYPQNNSGALMRFRHDIVPNPVIPFYEFATNRNGYLTMSGEIVYRKPAYYKSAPGSEVDNYGNWFRLYDEEGYRTYYSYTGLFQDDGLLISERIDGTHIKGRGNYIRGAKPTDSPRRINYMLHDFAWAGEYNSVPALQATSGWTNGLRPASYYIGDEVPSNDPLKKLEADNNRIGYINRKGEFQIKPAFFSAGEFSEGLAFVSKKDQFGKLQWGAIDTTGKMVIPYRYKLHPGRFNYGLSIIKAVDIPNVDYAFINKKGDIVFSIPKNVGDTLAIHLQDVTESNEHYHTFDYFHFQEGLQFVTIFLKEGTGSQRGKKYLMDTLGNYTAIEDRLLEQLPTKGFVTIMPELKNGNLFFVTTGLCMLTV